jgi:hypothetical protein
MFVIMASFRTLFKGIYAETFGLLTHLVQIATKFTKRAFLKDVLSSKNGGIKHCISLIKATNEPLAKTIKTSKQQQILMGSRLFLFSNKDFSTN